MSNKRPVDLIAKRILQLESWLEDAAPYVPFDQRHLDSGTPEQAYWHLGYRAALIDVLAELTGETAYTPDSATRSPRALPGE